MVGFGCPVTGREVACLNDQVETLESWPSEQQTEELKDRVGQVVLEVGFQRLARNVRRPYCCGRTMENKGKRLTTINSLSGAVTFEQNRYRCRECGAWQTLESLIRYVRPRLDRTDYVTYRSHDWQIGTRMIESTAKQPVGIRLKGPGMHWSHEGATAITALRAQDLNGLWHKFWKTLAL